jgi:hypothetical protein
MRSHLVAAIPAVTARSRNLDTALTRSSVFIQRRTLVISAGSDPVPLCAVGSAQPYFATAKHDRTIISGIGP